MENADRRERGRGAARGLGRAIGSGLEAPGKWQAFPKKGLAAPNISKHFVGRFVGFQGVARAAGGVLTQIQIFAASAASFRRTREGRGPFSEKKP
jgi:hypothetical protein